MASADKRELTHQLTTSSGGYELVITPVLFALFGFWLDRSFGWTPVLTISLAVFAVIGAGASAYLRYRYKMDEASAPVLAARSDAAAQRHADSAAVIDARNLEREQLQAQLDAAETAFKGGPEGRMV